MTIANAHLQTVVLRLLRYAWDDVHQWDDLTPNERELVTEEDFLAIVALVRPAEPPDLNPTAQLAARVHGAAELLNELAADAHQLGHTDDGLSFLASCALEEAERLGWGE